MVYPTQHFCQALTSKMLPVQAVPEFFFLLMQSIVIYIYVYTALLHRVWLFCVFVPELFGSWWDHAKRIIWFGCDQWFPEHWNQGGCEWYGASHYQQLFPTSFTCHKCYKWMEVHSVFQMQNVWCLYIVILLKCWCCQHCHNSESPYTACYPFCLSFINISMHRRNISLSHFWDKSIHVILVFVTGETKHSWKLQDFDGTGSFVNSRTERFLCELNDKILFCFVQVEKMIS